MVIWITGLPGAGKTTIANILYEYLLSNKLQTVLLDGDALRIALNNDAYDIVSRKELALTYSRLSKMLSAQGQIAICATVSMFDDVRQWNRDNISDYVEIYVKVDQKTLRERNQKDLYSDAQNGNKQNVHGFDLAIEEPKAPHLIVENNGSLTLEQIKALLLKEIQPWLKN